MNQKCDGPDFYNDLDLSFGRAWDVIEPGATKRSSPAHTPVVATVGDRGDPQLRVMVLRAADRTSRLLRFHTDARSAKIGEIGGGCSASVLMYDPSEKLQLRLGGTMSTGTDGVEVDAAWSGSTTFARRCYMTETAPGALSEGPTSGLAEWIEGKQPVEADLAGARQNFAILWFETRVVEWLYLANNGHRRARWEWEPDTETWSGRWLVP
jgi:pyridoxamine 5'-phosphate oxidase